MLLLLPWSLMMMKMNEGWSLLKIWIAEKAMTRFAVDRKAVYSSVQLRDL